MIKQSETFLMETTSGKPVYTNGYLKYSLDPTFGRQVMSLKAGDSEENRIKRLAKVAKVIGEPTRWIKGPVIDYINA